MIEWRNDKLKDLSTAELLELRDLAVASDIDEPENSPTKEALTQQIKDFSEREGVIVLRGFSGEELAASSLIVPSKTSKFFIVNKDMIDSLESTIGDSIDTAFVPAYLYLHPKYRGKGLGKTLSKETVDAAKENGFKFLLGYGLHNTVTRSFFSHNYDMIETELHCHSPLERDDMTVIRYTPI